MFENALKYCKEKAIDLLTGFVPKTYSMTEECNILGLYDDTFIITKQENNANYSCASHNNWVVPNN